MRSESIEQEIVINWCRAHEYKCKELELIYHCPNGGKRNSREAGALKRQGVKAGVPDLYLPVARHNYHGLYIEMKVGKNSCTENQMNWIKKLQEQGYSCEVCYGADNAIKVIQEYLGL